MPKEKVIIGRSEFVEFPEYSMNVPAKVDTGADRNSIHATRIKRVKVDEKEVLRCKILRGPYVYFDEFDKVNVKSSNGQIEGRFKVKLKIKVFGKVYRSSFSLTNRQNMKYPVLLGKNFLRNRFIVDVSQKNLSKPQIPS